MNKKIKKAIFPVGGLGTRFLPVTKSLPKEMLPIASKPLIQHAFEEALDAGIEQFIFITGRNKNAINNHFDHAYELEQALSAKEKKQYLSLTRDWVPDAGNVIFIRQQHPLGLGHAIWCARHLIDDEPFAILLADELFITASGSGLLQEMVATYEHEQSNIIAVADIEKEKTDRYGIVATKNDNGRTMEITDMVEKPSPELAPSNTSIIGRYILHPDVMHHLDKKTLGSGGEIQLTDAMKGMLNNHKFCGYRLDGKRLDCGNHLGFLEANIEFALRDPLFGDKAAHLIKKIAGTI